MKGRCPKRLFGVTRDTNDTLAIYFYSLFNMYTKPLSVEYIDQILKRSIKGLSPFKMTVREKTTKGLSSTVPELVVHRDNFKPILRKEITAKLYNLSKIYIYIYIKRATFCEHIFGHVDVSMGATFSNHVTHNL